MFCWLLHFCFFLNYHGLNVLPSCHGIVFFLIVVFLCYSKSLWPCIILIVMVLCSSWLLWSCVPLVHNVIVFCVHILLHLFFMHFVIKRQQFCYLMPLYMLQVANACCLTFCWNHVVHSRFSPLYLHNFFHKLI